MLSDRDALFAAICASPDEDTPRLMFADWLDENGQPERAEFIRLQCELARLDDDGGDSQPLYEFLRDRDYVTRPSADWARIDEGVHRRIALTVRAEDLLRRYGAAWVPKLPKKQVEWLGFHRGFPHLVRLWTLRPRDLAALAPRLRAAAPAVTYVTRFFNDHEAATLADAGLLGWLGGLDLGEDCWAGLREFGNRPEAAGVHTLKVHDDGYESATEVACALASTPHWTGLRELDFSKLALPADGAEALFGAKHLRSLRRLHLRSFGGGIGEWPVGTVRALAAGGFGNLISLRLDRCGLDDDAAEVLANCPHFKNLRALDLPNNNLTGRGVSALLCSPHLANVAFLGVKGNPGHGLDAERLANAKPGALRMFHAHGCSFRTRDVRALARCPRLRTLWYLDLDQNDLGTPAVRELVRGFKDRCPPILWLAYNRIDARGAEILAKWKAGRGLRVLHLKHNPLSDAGIRALFDSPNLADLDGLGVSGADRVTEARLRGRFKHHDIEY